MTKVTYEIVEHDGGWAYKVGDVFSETHRTRNEAVRAAKDAAQEQERSGDSEEIEYEDDKGEWHEEHADGRDRPDTDVKA